MATPPTRSMPQRKPLCPFNYARLYSWRPACSIYQRSESPRYAGIRTGAQHFRPPSSLAKNVSEFRFAGDRFTGEVSVGVNLALIDLRRGRVVAFEACWSLVVTYRIVEFMADT